MARRLSLTNLSNTLELAKMLHIQCLTEHCSRFINQHFTQCSTTDVFVDLPAETILKLLQSSDLAADSEDQVAMAILRWLVPCGQTPNDQRLEYAKAKLKEVQWHRTTVKCREKFMEVCKESHECAMLMFEVEQWLGAADREKLPCPFNIRTLQREEQNPARRLTTSQTERPHQKGESVPVDLSISTATATAQPGKGEKQDPVKPHITGKMRRRRKAAASSTKGGQPTPAPSARDKFYLFGGEAAERSKYCVLRYDPHQQQTEKVADWQDCANTTFSVIGEDSIFVVGGWIEWEYCSARVSEFVVSEARWRERAPLTIGREMHAATVVRTGSKSQPLLCVCGGVDTKYRCLTSCEVYDVNKNRWHMLPSMREARGWGPATACVPGDCRVFVFGGHNLYFFVDKCHSSVEFCRLDANWEAMTTSALAAHFWEAAAPMPKARCRVSVTAFRDNFIVAGGEDADHNMLNSVELFSPPDVRSPRGQWTTLAHMRKPRRDFAIFPFGDVVFALGSSYHDNTIEVFASSAATADSGNNLKSWRWSSRKPVGTLDVIVGAGCLC